MHFSGDVAYHPFKDVMYLVGEGKKVEVYNILDGRKIGEIGQDLNDVSVYWSGYPELSMRIASKYRGFDYVSCPASGRTITAGSLYDEGSLPINRLHVFVASTHKEVAKLKLGDTCVAVHPSGDTVAIVQSGQIDSLIKFLKIVESVVDDEIRVTCEDVTPLGGDNKAAPWLPSPLIHVAGMRFSPDGSLLALVGGLAYCLEPVIQMAVVDVASGMPLWSETISLVSEEVPPEIIKGELALPVENIVFDPSGHHIWVPYGNGELCAMDAKSGSVLWKTRAHESLIGTLDISWKHRVLVTGDLLGNIKIWEVL